jgi:penicillin-binding protein 1A
MLHSVVENGTAKRARLPGIHVAGKTGTTNAYRDAWFVGFTGNYATAVWLGNDDYQSTKRLTGGVLPAETWQKYMRVAMANEVVKPLPGLPEPAAPEESDEAAVASAEADAGLGNPGGSGRMAPETAAALGRLEDRFGAAAAAQPPQRQAALQQNGAAISP